MDSHQYNIDTLLNMKDKFIYIKKHPIKQQMKRSFRQSIPYLFLMSIVDWGLLIIIYSLMKMPFVDILYHCVWSVGRVYGMFFIFEYYLARSNTSNIIDICDSSVYIIDDLIDIKKDLPCYQMTEYDKETIQFLEKILQKYSH